MTTCITMTIKRITRKNERDNAFNVEEMVTTQFKEMKEREQRQSNVIFYVLKESGKEKSKDRLEDDKIKVNHLFYQ